MFPRALHHRLIVPKVTPCNRCLLNGVLSFALLNALLNALLTGLLGQVLGKRGFSHEVHETLLGNEGRDRLRIIH